MATLSYERCYLLLRVAYNGPFVEALKAAIPQQSRVWDPERRVWFISPAYLEPLIRLLARYFKTENIYLTLAMPESLSMNSELQEDGNEPKSN